MPNNNVIVGVLGGLAQTSDVFTEYWVLERPIEFQPRRLLMYTERNRGQAIKDTVRANVKFRKENKVVVQRINNVIATLVPPNKRGKAKKILKDQEVLQALVLQVISENMTDQEIADRIEELVDNG